MDQHLEAVTRSAQTTINFMIWPPSPTISHKGQKTDASKWRQMLNGPGGGWCYRMNEVVKLAAKAVAGISVLTLKWLSCQGVPLVGAPP